MIGIFSYYAKWINHFSDKIHVLNNVTRFPLNKTQKNVFEDLNLELANAAMQPIDENIPFVVDTDASDFAISATLNQDGRPVAFYSASSTSRKGGSSHSRSYPSLDTFLLGRHFTLITDQKSVSYMCNYKSSDKIKNNKTMSCALTLFV